MTLDAPADRIERFHQVLVEQIRDLRPEYLHAPFTVAEIYQDLVPYAAHRDRLGVEMNGDYEDVLLRLLAGEGEYLVLESSHARERLRNELRSPNPDTGLYREFAAVDVRLSSGGIPGAPQGQSEADGGSEAGAGSDGPRAEPGASPAGHAGAGADAGANGSAPDDESSSRAADGPVLDVEALAPTAGPEAAEDSGASFGSDERSQCAWCREELPVRDNLNYCPFCGVDVHVVPCPSCGESLEPNWRFCIACGAETSAD